MKNSLSFLFGRHEQQLKEIKFSNYYKVWTTCMDGHSCSECVRLEGTAVPMNASFCVGNRYIKTPPLHKGCRCTLLYVEEDALEHDLRRAYNSFLAFSNMANDSIDVHAAVSGYFGSLYFLEKIISAPAKEFHSAGLRLPAGYDLKQQLSVIKEHKDQIFNQAIKRAYDDTVSKSSKLKTEKGKQERLQRLKSEILAEGSVLSSVNVEFLNALIP